MSGGSNSDSLTDIMASPTTGSSTFSGGSMNDGSPLATAIGDSSIPAANSFGPSRSAQHAADKRAGQWNKEPGVAARDTPARDRALKNKVTEIAGHPGTGSNTADKFDNNYLAEGKTGFNFMAPEVRDFVNRSPPSS